MYLAAEKHDPAAIGLSGTYPEDCARKVVHERYHRSRIHMKTNASRAAKRAAQLMTRYNWILPRLTDIHQKVQLDFTLSDRYPSEE